ncbi:MAG: ABC transporter substrate-binding protein [Deltaproteobacteria bacterium]|nr:ABC transporter substrate-binding protein [Deltaproteobacteria bacterium]
MNSHKLIVALAATLFLAVAPAAADWRTTLDEARNRTVYFNAWGGSSEVNQYLRWASEEVMRRYDIVLKHVKVSDIAQTVSVILAEKAGGRHDNGSVDMVWINGENFKAMKQAGLLYGPFTGKLPNYRLVNLRNLPLNEDFTIPVEGLEAPWGVGQLNIIYDRAKGPFPGVNSRVLLEYAQKHVGRISYPKPPQFHGSSFLKQLLLELAPDTSPLYRPVEKSDMVQVTRPLWRYLDRLHPVAWRKGRAFPTGSAHMKQLMDDGELDIAISFNPQDAATAARNGTLPPTVAAGAMEIGALTNCHFLAIPFNSGNKAAAEVVINFLLSPEAQARKADTRYWGDPTILDLERLTERERGLFDPDFHLFAGIAEPHPSWQTALEKMWQERYGH